MSKEKTVKITRLIYFVPIFMGLLGGILMYIAVKDSDQEKANDSILISILSTIGWVFAIWLITYLGFLNDMIF